MLQTDDRERSTTHVPAPDAGATRVAAIDRGFRDGLLFEMVENLNRRSSE